MEPDQEPQSSHSQFQDVGNEQLSKEMEKLLFDDSATEKTPGTSPGVVSTTIADPEVRLPGETDKHKTSASPSSSTDPVTAFVPTSSPLNAIQPQLQHPSNQSSQSTILLLSLDPKTPFDQTHASLLDALLSSPYTVARAKKPASVISFLSKRTPTIILATDAGLTLPEYKPVYEKVVEYVRNGGSLLCCGGFATFVGQAGELDGFFKGFGDSVNQWSMEWYGKTTVFLNEEASSALLSKQAVPEADQSSKGKQPAGQHTSKIPSKLTLNGIYLKNVGSKSAIYLPDSTSYDQSFESLAGLPGNSPSDFEKLSIDNLSQTPIAFASVGEGKLGFVGETGGERDMMDIQRRTARGDMDGAIGGQTDKIVLAMCGIDPTNLKVGAEVFSGAS